MENKKIKFIELLKIIAIIMVLYSHRSTYNLAYKYIEQNIISYIYQGLATISKVAVPLFFMTSGVVLLGKKEKFSVLFKKRISRWLIVMVICSFIKTYDSLSIVQILKTFFMNLNWYMYAYLCYLFMLPILRIIAQNIEEKDAYIYI